MSLPKKAIRRNSLVKSIWNPAFCGRVIRTLPDGSVLWLTISMRFMINWPEALTTENYPYWGSPGSLRELSLRNFKRKAVRFHGKNAYNTPLDYHEIFDGRSQFTREETLRYRESRLNELL